MRIAPRMQALLLSLFFITSLAAQTRPKVAVVLSGGGAKGFAHVALLEALEEEGIPIDLITGTSMGAMIGSLYASGYSASELRHIVTTTDMMSLILDHAAASSPMPPEAFDLSKANLISYPMSREGIGAAPGLVGDEKILNFMACLLAKNYNITSFDQLPIPYRSVGTDILTFTPFVYDSGSLLKAVRGSMSLPLLFTPASTGTGRWVVDGGLVNNLPVQLARQLGADIVIACDVASNLPQDTTALATASDMGIHLFNFFITPNAVAQHQDATVLITPDLQPYNTLSFMFPAEILELGEKAVAEQRAAIHEIALQLKDAGVSLQPAEPDRISVYAAKSYPTVESVILEDVSAAGSVPLPSPSSYSWLINTTLTDNAMKRLVNQLTRDRTKYNLASLSFETRPGSTPESCTLVLTANHYDTNPGILGLGGAPILVATISSGQVTGMVFPEMNIRLHLEQPFSHDYFGSFGSTISAGFNLTPQFSQLGNMTLHADLGAAIMNGGLSPHTSYSWLDKPLLDDTGFTVHLGLEGHYTRYSTVRTGIQYSLNNTYEGLINTAVWYGNLVLNSLDDPVTGWNGIRIDAETSAGKEQWSASYRQIHLRSLVSRVSSLGYELSLGTRRGPAALTENYYEYGGFQGMCGYPTGTLTRQFALAGIRYQTSLGSVLGMPLLAQLQVKAGLQNISSSQPADAGYGAYLMFDTPVSTIILGFSHSITAGKYCISLGLQ